MSAKVKALSSLLGLAILVAQVKSQTSTSHTASSILQPLARFQIILRLPNCDTITNTWTPFRGSLDFLTQNQSPTQVFCGLTLKNTRPHYQVTKNVENQVTWLAFHLVENVATKVSLYKLVESCCLRWGWHAQSDSTRKDVIYLIADTTAAPGWPATDGYRFDIMPCFVPIFLLVIQWSGTGIQNSSPVWTLDTCYKHRSVCHVIFIQNYFTEVEKGIHGF